MSLKVDLKEDDLQTIKCNNCDYKCRYNIQLKKHMKIHESHAKYTCKKCDFSTEFVASTWEHKLTVHPEESDNISAKESENFILKIVAEQTTSLSEDVYSLKRDTKDALVAITKALDTCIDNLKNDNNEKCKVLGNTVVKLVNKISRIEKALTIKPSRDVTKTKPAEKKLRAKKPNTVKKPETVMITDIKKPVTPNPPPTPPPASYQIPKSNHQ